MRKLKNNNQKKKRHCKFTLAKFLAPVGPSKGMKVKKNTKKNLA
jgi:hypothetical protein